VCVLFEVSAHIPSAMADVISRLPPETLQRCLAVVRVTELAPACAASAAMRRACRHPELWRRDVGLRCPELQRELDLKRASGLPTPSWRAACIGHWRRTCMEERHRLFPREMRLNEAVRVGMAAREDLISRRGFLQRCLEDLNQRLLVLSADAQSCGEVTSSSSRAASRRLRSEVDEVKSFADARREELRRISDELVHESSATLTHVRGEAARCASARRMVDSRLALIPPDQRDLSVGAGQCCSKQSTRRSRVAVMAAMAGERAADALQRDSQGRLLSGLKHRRLSQ